MVISDFKNTLCKYEFLPNRSLACAPTLASCRMMLERALEKVDRHCLSETRTWSYNRLMVNREPVDCLFLRVHKFMLIILILLGEVASNVDRYYLA